MIRPKNLDMNRIEELFNEHFIFNKEDLNKGITMWTISPKRDALCPKCGTKLTKDNVSEGYAFACAECDEDFYEMEARYE